MDTFIERLRKKPDHERHAIGAGVTVAVVGVIALLWVATLPARLDGVGAAPVAREEQRAGEAQRANVGSAFEDIAEMGSRALKPFKERFREMQQ